VSTKSKYFKVNGSWGLSDIRREKGKVHGGVVHGGGVDIKILK
jgi:hypothetical protein